MAGNIRKPAPTKLGSSVPMMRLTGVAEPKMAIPPAKSR